MEMDMARQQKAVADAVAAERERCARLLDERHEKADLQAVMHLGMKEDMKAVGWRCRAMEALEAAADIRTGRQPGGAAPVRRRKWLGLF